MVITFIVDKSFTTSHWTEMSGYFSIRNINKFLLW